MTTLSVVVPATDNPATLPRCLAAIERAADGPEEVIVVGEPVDLSASEARNVGAARAVGDVVVFVDADVEVHADAFVRLRSAFDTDTDTDTDTGAGAGAGAGVGAGPAPTAVFGSYDESPSAPGVVSRFRNLLHHDVHQRGAGRAETFWTGLGAVRRQAFLALGGFDGDRYPHPSIEDIEFGTRLVAAGGVVHLDPGIQCTHLKAWTLRSMVWTDLARRGVPWVALQVVQGRASRSLNCGWRHRLSAIAVVGVLLAVVSWSWWSPWLTLAGVGALVGCNGGFYVLLVRRLGVVHGALGVFLHGIHHLLAVAAVPVGLAVAGSALVSRGNAARALPPLRAQVVVE